MLVGTIFFEMEKSLVILLIGKVCVDEVAVNDFAVYLLLRDTLYKISGLLRWDEYDHLLT